MGTSVNQASPKIPVWEISRGVLGSKKIDVTRQQREVWKAASRHRGQYLNNQLCDLVVQYGFSLAGGGGSPIKALSAFNEYADSSETSSLGHEFAKRALLRCVQTNAAHEDYAAELFGETTEYYISRDLPGFVGAKDRVQSVSELIELKSEISDSAKRTAKEVATNFNFALDKNGLPNPQKWTEYVEKVISKLSDQ